jgi:ABC-type nitrate/sulfonate/bicarbonate transport system substrate-binding protein
MANWRRRVLDGIVAAATMGIVGTGFAAEAPLRIMVFQGVQNLPLVAAQAKGFFAKRGLSVEVKIAPNSDELRDGLAQGRYQIVHTAVDNAVAMVELAKVDVAVLMGGDNGWNNLYVQPEIRSYDDLRGKTVIVDAPNTAFALMVYKMLQLNGLRRSDYVVKPIGATPLRLQAMLKDNSYAAGMLNLPFSIRAERAGLKNMGVAVKAIGPYLSTAGFALRSWAPANADTLVRYIQAYIEGLRWALDATNKTEAVEMLVDWLKIPKDIAGQSYDVAADPQGGFARDAKVDSEGFKNVLKLRAEIEGQWGGAPPAAEKYLELSYYSRALSGL